MYILNTVLNTFFFKIEVIVDVFAFKVLIYQLEKQRRKKKEKENSSSNDMI
jgi:hypothetical protein